MSTRDLGALLVFWLICMAATPLMVRISWPRASAPDARRWRMLYWAGYSLFAMAGVIMWLAPAVGAVPWIVAFGAGVLLVFYGIFRQDNDDPTGSERRG